MKKVVLISGGSDGLGLAIVKELIANCSVVVIARNEAKLKTLQNKIGCDYRVGDVTRYEEMRRAVDSVLEEYSQIDILINNAGIWIQGELETNEPEKIKQVLETNTLGTIYLTRAVVPSMKEKKSGLIINTISQAGIYAKAQKSVYHASKFAAAGFTKSLELELTPYGVRVCGLYPGLMRTELFDKSGNCRNMECALEVKEVSRLVSFIISLDESTVIPEVGIKHLGY